MPKFLTFISLILLVLIGCSPNTPQKITEQPINGPLQAHFINVGQADATLLHYQENEKETTILIDTGNWTSNETLDYLQDANIQKIDLIIITHPHADHIGQLPKILRAIPVDEVWMNGDATTSDIFEQSLIAIEEVGADYYEPTAGETFSIGPLDLTILHPTEPIMGTNDNSISLIAQFNEIRFLFTGDAEKRAEQAMLDRDLNLQADVYQLGHHGSNTSSTDLFLDQIQPQLGIYSAGEDSQYGHPDPEIVERFKIRGIPLYGTNKDGTIQVLTDGKKLTVETLSSPLPTQEKNEQAPQASCISINEASVEELSTLTHIGKERALAIIEARPFKSLDELTKIAGLGEKRVAEIKEQGIACLGGI